MINQREFRLLCGCNLVHVFQVGPAASDDGRSLIDAIRQNLLRNLVEVTGMGRKTKGMPVIAMHEIGNQRWVMRKMGMKMV